MFYKIKKKIFYSLHRKELIEMMKPKLVYWYIIFKGDQNKILNAIKDSYGLDNHENYHNVMKNVDLDDYITALEKDFYKYSLNPGDFVVKKLSTRK